MKLTLLPQSITVTVDGSEMQLVSYYTIEDKLSGKLKAKSFIVFTYDDPTYLNSATIVKTRHHGPRYTSRHLPFCKFKSTTEG